MSESYSIEAVLSANVRAFVDGIRQAQGQMDDFVSGNAKTFDSFKKVGAAATAGGVAIAGGLGFAVKVAADFEQGMSKVGAISGASAGDMDLLAESARDWGSKSKFSATEAASAFEYMALAGWKTTDMLGGIEGVMNLAAASGEDLARTSDIVTDGLSAFGLAASDSGRFADVLAAASSNANTDVAGLGEAFKYVAPVAGALGYTIEDTSRAIGLMANSGIKGSQAGSSLRTMMTNLAKPTKAMKKEMDRLGLSLTDSEGNMKTFDTIMDDLRLSFGDMGEAQQAASAATIFGKEAMSGALAIINASETDYNKLTDAINNSEGAAADMAAIMQDNLNGAMTNLKSAMEEVAIAIGSALIPVMEKAVGFAQMLADKFNGLDDKTKTTMAVIAALAAGFLLLVGPIMMLIGFIPSMLAGFAALSTVAGAIGTALALITGPIALVTLGLAAIAVGAVFLAKKMSEDAIPEVERFGEGVSEATEEALTGFFELSDGIGQALMELKITSGKVTEETKNEIVGKYAEMNAQILEGMASRHTEELAQMESMFLNSSALTDKEKEEILTKKQEGYDREVEYLEYKNKRIAEILQLAADENRELTQQEAYVINNIHQQAQETAVKVLSESEMEQKIILERMADSAGEISARQAAEVVKNSAEQREKTVAEAEGQYNETYAAILRMRDETGELSEEQATKLIAEAKKSRDESVKYAENMHEDVVSEAKKQAEEHVDLVNWETGEILSKWDVFVNDVKKFFNELGKALADSGKAMWTETAEWFRKIYTSITTYLKTAGVEALKSFVKMLSDAREKFGNIKTAAETIFAEVTSAIKTKLTEAVTLVGTKISEMPGKVTEKIGAMKSAGIDLVKGLISGIKNMGLAAVEAISGVVGGVINKAKSLLNIKSPSRVFIQIGDDVVAGMAIGINDTAPMVQKAVTDLNLMVIDIAEHFKNEEKKVISKGISEIAVIEKRAREDVAKINRAAASKKRKTTIDENTRIRRIQEDAHKKITAIEKKNISDSIKLTETAQKNMLKEIKLHIADKKTLGEIGLVGEAALWESSIRLFAEGTKERVEAQKNYNKLHNAAEKERMENIKSHVKEQREQGNMNIADEIRLWNALYRTAKKGSEQYESAMRNHQETVKELRTQVESINKDYNGRMLAIDKDYNNESKKLQDDFNKAYESKVNQLLSFAGIFDEFKRKNETTGKELISNLESQVDALSDYAKVISSLDGRIDDDTLMDELRSMGVKSLGELQALNSLSDKELTRYTKLYRDKFKLASSQAAVEMKPLKDDVDNQLIALKKSTSILLDEVKVEWESKIDNIVNGASKKFDSMRQVGIDAMAGLGEGMKSMNSQLQAQAKSIADAIKKTISKAFDINSPSRWMRDHIGENMMIGWMDGIAGMERLAISQARNVAMAVGGAFQTPTSSGIADQVNALNRQNNRRMQTDFRNNINVNRQPAVINVLVGGHQIAREIVDDISRLQSDNYSARSVTHGY